MKLLMHEGVEPLYLELSDAQWHPETRVVRHAMRTKKFSNPEEVLEILAEAVERGEILRGESNVGNRHNVSYRMDGNYVRLWRSIRGLPEKATPQKMNAPRVFGGIIEDDIWEQVPLYTFDVVHFHTSESGAEITKEAIGLHGMTVYNFEGLARVYTLEGSFAYNILQSLAQERPELEISGIRFDHNVRRREIQDLPTAFAREFFDFYGKFGQRLIYKNGSSIEKYLNSKDDIQQQIYLWVIDAYQRYDASTNIPFAAFLSGRISQWVHDLPRKAYGRAVSDAELHISRARTEFLMSNNRYPTIEELSDMLNEPIEKIRKKLESVESVSKIRTAESLTNSEGDSIDIVGEEDSTTRIEKETEQQIISLALTTSALTVKRTPQVVSWLNIYQRVWGTDTTRKENPNETEKAIMANMKKIMEDTL